jgi:flagellar L-ring protein precursor FlgH
MKTRHLLPLASLLSLAACGTLQHLSEIGRPPAISQTADPTQDPNWRKVSMPMPTPDP